MEKRIQWTDFPRPLRAAIEERTGPITAGHAVTGGQNSPVAAVIDTRDGKVFVKGLTSDHPRVITQEREAAAAPLVSRLSPALLWHFNEAGWNVLGFEHIPGRAADYSQDHPTSFFAALFYPPMNKVSATDTWLELALIPSVGARRQLGTAFISDVQRFLADFAATAPVPGLAQGHFPSVARRRVHFNGGTCSWTLPPTVPSSSERMPLGGTIRTAIPSPSCGPPSWNIRFTAPST